MTNGSCPACGHHPTHLPTCPYVVGASTGQAPMYSFNPKRRYRYTEAAFGDFIVSGDGRMFGSEYAIPLEAIIEAMESDFVIIPKSELPIVREDGKLGGFGLTHGGLPTEDAERAEFYRQEAAGKLALALHAAQQADRKAKLTVKLAADLEANLQHSDMTAFAKDLVRLGWTKPGAN